MPLGGALIGGATSIIGGLIGSSSAAAAAKRQAAAAQAAANNENKAVGVTAGIGYDAIAQANNAVTAGTGAATSAVQTGQAQAAQAIGNAGANQAGIYNTNMQGLQPYQQAGTYGLTQLQNQAGTFSFDPNNVTNNPAYQFQLAQGEKAVQNSAAGRGMLMSGATMKAMDNYSQGLASTSEQALYNQALSTYNTNLGGYQTLANLGTNANSQGINAGANYGSQLTSLAGLGTNVAMGGAGLISGANMQGAQMNQNTALQGNEFIGNATMQGAGAVGNYLTNQGNAQAAGAVGQGNAWSNAISGVGSSLLPPVNMRSYNQGIVNQGDPTVNASGGGWTDPYAGQGIVSGPPPS